MKWFRRTDTVCLDDLKWIEDTAIRFGRIVNEERDAGAIRSRVANEIADTGEGIASRNQIRWSLVGKDGSRIGLLALRGIDRDNPSQMRWHSIIKMGGRYAGLKLTIAHEGNIAISAEPVPGRKLGPYAIRARDELIKRLGIRKLS